MKIVVSKDEILLEKRKKKIEQHFHIDKLRIWVRFIVQLDLLNFDSIAIRQWLLIFSLYWKWYILDWLADDVVLDASESSSTVLIWSTAISFVGKLELIIVEIDCFLDTVEYWLSDILLDKLEFKSVDVTINELSVVVDVFIEDLDEWCDNLFLRSEHDSISDDLNSTSNEILSDFDLFEERLEIDWLSLWKKTKIRIDRFEK